MGNSSRIVRCAYACHDPSLPAVRLGQTHNVRKASHSGECKQARSEMLRSCRCSLTDAVGSHWNSMQTQLIAIEVAISAISGPYIHG